MSRLKVSRDGMDAMPITDALRILFSLIAWQTTGSSPPAPASRGMNLRALWTLKREAKSSFMFVSERVALFHCPDWPHQFEHTGIAARIGFKVHPHMLRYAAGFVLANKCTDTPMLQAYLGHRSI